MDLNKELQSIQKSSSEIEDRLKTLFLRYEDLCKESTRQYSNERTLTGSTNGLEDFYRLTQILKRNRDLMGSLFRGIKGLRPLENFKFVEEEVKVEPKKVVLKKKTPTYVSSPVEPGSDS